MHLKTDLHKMNYHTVQNSAEVLSAFYLLSPWPYLDTPECDRRYPANTDRADPCGWGGNPLHLHRRGRRWKARRRHRRLSGTPSPSGVAASSAGSLSAMRSWRARTPAAPRTRRWDIRPSTHRWPGGGGDERQSAGETWKWRAELQMAQLVVSCLKQEREILLKYWTDRILLLPV